VLGAVTEALGPQGTVGCLVAVGIALYGAYALVRSGWR
jgi:hypothetical protein